MAIGNRAHTILLVLILTVGIAIVAMLATGVRGGSLDPAGPVGSTDGVLEPGTPISALPYEITTPGYYYLTKNLVGTEGNAGITISSLNVTIDLKGFTLEGVSGSLDGIYTSGTSNILIRNGTITSWSGSGILVESPTFSEGSTLYDLHVSNNSGHGIRVGDRAIIHDVTSRNNGLSGITTSRNAVIERCIVSNNGGDGVNAPFNASITDCSVTNNQGDGISGVQGIIVEGNSVQSNGLDGIQVGPLSVVAGNSTAINGLLVTNGAGIRAVGAFGRIENNTVAANDYGIATTEYNLITGNFASNNGDNYGQVLAGALGPVLDGSTIGDAGVNPHANFQ